jgi:hypothetical protein
MTIADLQERVDLHQVHVMNHSSVLTNVTAVRENVVYWRISHFCDDGQRFVRIAILKGLQVVSEDYALRVEGVHLAAGERG